MITATATGEAGMRIILLGLTRENVTRLMAGEPIRVSAVHHAGFPTDLSILLCFGETERALVEQLKPLFGDDTKFIAVPKPADTPGVS
jgi:hypothetical protein